MSEDPLYYTKAVIGSHARLFAKLSVTLFYKTDADRCSIQCNSEFFMGMHILLNTNILCQKEGKCSYNTCLRYELW